MLLSVVSERPSRGNPLLPKVARRKLPENYYAATQYDVRNTLPHSIFRGTIKISAKKVEAEGFAG
jgi:hypothetical protein